MLNNFFTAAVRTDEIGKLHKTSEVALSVVERFILQTYSVFIFRSL